MMNFDDIETDESTADYEVDAGQDVAVPTQSLGVAVAVVEPDGPYREYLTSMLGGGVSSFATLEELTPRLNGLSVVTVLGPSFSDRAMLDDADRNLRSHPDVGTILVASQLSTALLQHALRSGVKDVLAAPVEQSQLLVAVQRVASDLNVISQATHPPTQETASYEGSDSAKVVTVFSTKGGAGKSMIAANLAVTLARRAEKPVCLVDADLQFGDIAVMLKMTPNHTIVDAVNNIDRLDHSLLQSYLAEHEQSGLWVLPAPLEPAFADQINANDVNKIVDLLRDLCSFVIVDTPSHFNEVVLGLIESSDDVLLVAGMDIPNIKNVKIGLQTLRLLNTPMEKLHLVLNRANSKVKLDVSEVERTLQLRADILVPSDIVVPQSVNRGVPVTVNAPKSGVSRAIEDLADLFVPAEKKKRR